MTVKLKVRIADLHPTHIIARLRALPRWQIVAAACVIGLVGGGMGVALTRYTTHARGFCLSCHQYQRIGFEGQSKLHPDSVVCADCHREGHGILPTRFSADSGNVRVKCLHCHEDIASDEQVGYQYNVHEIRITHASHLARPGTTCTTCHYNVAHDRREQPTNRPTMEGCFRCHDAESQDCTTCHPQGSLRAPENGSAIEPDTCGTCHLDWETRAHEVGGVQFRHGPHLAGGLRCEQCHSNKSQHGELAISKQSCSQECHQRLPLSHMESWLQRHGPDFTARARDCAGCHEARFCRACHGLDMPHPETWRDEHARAAQDEQTCARCHERDSCQACHQTARPASHTADWADRHQHARPEDCAQCHQQSFCTGCHAGKKPTSHAPGWVSRHSAKAKARAEVCATCHGTGLCQSCHGGVELPHAADWLLTHRSQSSFARGSVCFRCHDYEQTCALCHGEEPPKES